MQTVKGTLDYNPILFNRINYICNAIKNAGIKLGGKEIDTPRKSKTI